MTDLQRAVEAVSDEDITRAIAYYRQTPTRVWGSRMVSMLTELQSRRRALIPRSLTEEDSKCPTPT